ncbi:hypothetical protein [Phyllobacterium salinisoli]|uniref:hypothetical protein n=1 Tax=Phyllobacterium salinisoli TaxID=1899321 RepID=UPI00190FB19D|nr:hypothetical protein [Phyllobacterium salinisoli]
MLSRFIAILMLAPGFIAPAFAGSIETPAEPRHIRSIDYVGYDGVDATGKPICRVCEADKAAGIARRAALEERRKRAREYMARMQGQKPATEQGVDAMPVGALTDKALGDVKLRPSIK